MFDDLPTQKKENEFPRNLVEMSVSELQEYVGELQDEIKRVEDDMEKKKASQEAAASVFK